MSHILEEKGVLADQEFVKYKIDSAVVAMEVAS